MLYRCIIYNHGCVSLNLPSAYLLRKPVLLFRWCYFINHYYPNLMYHYVPIVYDIYYLC